ncbi:hypothetical protein ACTMTF_08475 [Nonomuraea sp. ZG12]|uniref:hypothetical protein n=1 Tax=Nonomuraea sp. ZG12 TaxID=3452207 RepID=UPI003F8A607A
MWRIRAIDLATACATRPCDDGGHGFMNRPRLGERIVPAVHAAPRARLKMAAIVISLLFGGRDPYTIFNLVDAGS